MREKHLGISLLIRADSTPQLGTGHIMRCIALGQAWREQDEEEVRFIGHCQSDAIRKRILKEGFAFDSLERSYPDPSDLEQVRDVIRDIRERNGACFFVLDGYHFDPFYQQAIRETGQRLLVIDDMAHYSQYYADILLNQNIGVEGMEYRCSCDTTLLMGIRYALLRREFLAWRDLHRGTAEVARRVLVTMGGSDPENMSLVVLHGIEELAIEGLEVVVLVGDSNPHLDVLKAWTQDSKAKVRLEQNRAEVPELMAWSDVAISGSGSTCWELAFMGVPSVVLTLAENQRRVAKEIAEFGAGIALGWFKEVKPGTIAQAMEHLSFSSELREKMSVSGRKLVDGYGPDRVVMHMRGERIWLRPVLHKDAEILWHWANDPRVRAVSFSSGSICWRQHVEWLSSKVNDSRCAFFVAVNEEEKLVGQIRFDIHNDEADISIAVDPALRNRGYGSAIIKVGSQRIRRLKNIQRIHAYIKEENKVSERAFTKCGFTNAGITNIQDEPAVHLVLDSDENSGLH